MIIAPLSFYSDTKERFLKWHSKYCFSWKIRESSFRTVRQQTSSFRKIIPPASLSPPENWILRHSFPACRPFISLLHSVSWGILYTIIKKRSGSASVSGFTSECVQRIRSWLSPSASALLSFLTSFSLDIGLANNKREDGIISDKVSELNFSHIPWYSKLVLYVVPNFTRN